METSIHSAYTFLLLQILAHGLKCEGEDEYGMSVEVFAFKDHDKHWVKHEGTHDRIIVILDYSIEQLSKYGINLEEWEEDAI